jgi:NAD-dependent SIR2 family protein deacetylase
MENFESKPEVENQMEKENIFLNGPDLVSPEEEKKGHSGLNFCFSSNQRKYHLGINEGKPFFMVEYFDSLPENLTEEEKQKFEKKTRVESGKEKVTYILKSETPPLVEKEEEIDPETSLGKNYRIAKAREFKKTDEEVPKPKELNLAELVEFLRNNRIVFYTGAGISVSGNVHGMKDLENSLGIQKPGKADDFLRNCINNPEITLEAWIRFVESLDSPPTEAHKSLAQLAQKLNVKIFSENVDHLQEGAGVRPVRISGPWLKENIQIGWLKDLDAIITVGLSYDDRAFLGWYKENNPAGKIVSINLSQPTYLGDEDFLVKGDLQKLIPELEKEFAAKTEIR